MANGQDKDPVISALRGRVDDMEGRIEEYARLLYGDPMIGFSGLREEVRHLRELMDGLIQERNLEQAERKGMKRIVNIVGVTSVSTLVTLLLTLWQSGIFSS